MSVLTSIIGGIVVIALVVRGATGFYDDFKAKTSKAKQEEKQ